MGDQTGSKCKFCHFELMLPSWPHACCGSNKPWIDLNHSEAKPDFDTKRGMPVFVHKTYHFCIVMGYFEVWYLVYYQFTYQTGSIPRNEPQSTPSLCKIGTFVHKYRHPPFCAKVGFCFGVGDFYISKSAELTKHTRTR